MSKYGNVRTQDDGYDFDSLAEHRRYCELKLLLQHGYISALEVHPRYILQDAFQHNGKKIGKIEYEGDFQYIEDGKKVCEDVKGFTTQAFQIKRKMFLRLYPDIEFRMVKA